MSYKDSVASPSYLNLLAFTIYKISINFAEYKTTELRA